MVDARKAVRWLVDKVRPRRDVQIQPVDVLFPDAEVIELLPSRTMKTEEAVDMTFVPGVAHYQQATYTLPAVSAYVLCDVLYCPSNNVVMTDDGCVVAESISTIRRLEYLDRYALSARWVTRLAGTYAGMRSVHNQFYHALIDNPPRLWALGHPSLRRCGEIQVLLRGGPTGLESYISKGLKPPNVRLRTLKGGRLYRLEKMVFVSYMTRRHAAVHHPEYLEAFHDAFLPARPRQSRRRIYISRAGRTRNERSVLNEDEVMRVLRPLGFEAYLLEELTLRDQAELFFDAETVVAPHGAGLANLVYASGATVVEWFPSPHVVPSFYFLAKSLGHRYVHRHADGEWRSDDMVIDTGQLLESLRALNVVPAAA